MINVETTDGAPKYLNSTNTYVLNCFQQLIRGECQDAK